MMFRLATSLLLVFAICLPGLAVAEEEYWEYTFRPGDSIWKIAERYTTTVNNWGEITKINEIRQGPDRRILPGTRIVIPVSMLKLQPAPARVIATSGGASLIRANGEKSVLATGMLLYSGDRIITGDKQNLRMQFADKSELQVLPNSEVVLDKLSHHKHTGMVDTRVRLNTGSVNTWVEKLKPDSRYEIITPAAVTAVRGTAFRLSADGTLVSRTEVTEGTVDVSAGVAEKSVKDGYGIVAEKDKPLPEPVKLLPPPELQLELVADKTELRLSWIKLEGAKYYHYQLATDDKFNQIIVDTTSVNSIVEMNDLQPGQYYVRVRGVDQYKLEGVDSVSEFIVQQPPARDDSYWMVIMSVGLFLTFL